MKGRSESVMKALLTLCALAAVGFVAVICVYLTAAGVPAIREIGAFDFLFGPVWDPTSGEDPRFGVLPMLLTSLYGAAGALLLGLPVGFLAALFLAKAAPRGLAKVLRFAVELLAGVPSVVYGLVGMLVLVPWVRERFSLPAGDTLLAAILVLAVMILPTVISVSQNALAAVPQSYEEGSLALGATRLETWLRVTAPAAKSGVAAAAALGVGRALGETMAILMVAGNVANFPALTRSVRFLTTGIAVELNYASPGSLQRQALFSIGLVLLVFLLVINLVLHRLRRGRQK
jgi:phosphate transport system permease protein